MRIFSLKVAILASRDQLCIHEKVKKEENSHLKVWFLKNFFCKFDSFLVTNVQKYGKK
jgi:hypothetical protein